MSNDGKTPEAFSLKRWSRVKLESTRPPAQPGANDPPSSAAPAPPAPAAPNPARAAAPTPAADLPAIDSLTIDSDFSAFLQPKIDEALKRKALKKLFGDPRFNVMDGLDVYIDDYSKPDPLAPEVARQLAQARAILGAGSTRIDAQGNPGDVAPVEQHSSVGLASQETRGVETASADPAAPNAGPLTPGTEPAASTRAENAGPGKVVPERDPKTASDPR